MAQLQEKPVKSLEQFIASCGDGKIDRKDAKIALLLTASDPNHDFIAAHKVRRRHTSAHCMLLLLCGTVYSTDITSLFATHWMRCTIRAAS